jgi:hypothetical protein
MTIQEFKNTGFYKGIKAVYKGESHLVYSVDFEECLLGLVRGDDIKKYHMGIEDMNWVRCENCTLLNSEQGAPVSDTSKAL